jgi:hypothetical protein
MFVVKGSKRLREDTEFSCHRATEGTGGVTGTDNESTSTNANDGEISARSKLYKRRNRCKRRKQNELSVKSWERYYSERSHHRCPRSPTVTFCETDVIFRN